MFFVGPLAVSRSCVAKCFGFCCAVQALALVACTQGTPRHVGATDTAVIAVVTDLVGTTAPCGCTSRPLGGLDHMAARIEAQAKMAPLGLLVAGNTLFPEPDPKPAMQGFVRQTGATILATFNVLKPMAMALGDWDAGLLAKGFLGAEQAQLAASTLTNIVPQNRPLTGGPISTMATLGHVKVGIIAAAPSVALPAKTALAPTGPSLAHTFNKAAQALRKDGADLVILAWPSGVGRARDALVDDTGVDIIVAGSDGAPSAPEALGEATLVDGGARGEYVGFIHLHKNQGGRFVLFDGGHAQQQEAKAKRARYLAEAQALPPGAAQNARLARAEKLLSATEQGPTAPPSTAYFSVEMVPMDAHLPTAAWATKMLGQFNQSLCAVAEADTAQRTCLPAIDAQSAFVGSTTCQACHQEAYAVWSQQKHAHAYKTLVDAGKQCDLSCIGCHVVGYEQPGGFCKLVDAPTWANVGCENCHGPGSGHVGAPTDRTQWAKTFVRDTPEATCKGCHNAQHSDQFNFATYRPQVLGPGHGLKSASASLP